ncbi:transglycosylase SLT domain-containing protein [Streptomyces sp. NPDC050560]|uniref:transglycosylase SLT domain-containing protein n=1 Tax=Streptomyces sp. NPDC050560 TaxID=3365630 RepID=UPI0037AC104B
MPATAKHRRSRTSRITRRLVALGTGGAALALPLISATTANAAPAAAQVAPAKSAPETYVTVAGDSLAKIAKKFSLPGGWQKLYERNKQAVGAHPGLIHPGLRLTLTDKAPAKPSAATKTAAAKVATAVPAAAKTYPDNLDGWIRESLDVMAQRGIPGSYNGIYRNIIRESAGNPLAINNWDSNAVKGTPSKGLLQVIDPTFRTYHVAGTSMDSYDPVANITAACNYAAAVYGSIDNVNGPY